MPPCTHLLYLHGFRSSPQSFKSQRTAQWLAAHRPEVHWCCPQLPPSPLAAMQLVLQLTHDWPTDSMAVMGSSLGGFYARLVSAQRHCRAVLINPAVNPARDLAPHVGTLTAWHDPTASFEFKPDDIIELETLAKAPAPDPHLLMAVVAQGDEVLSWQEMWAIYGSDQGLLLPGGDHALSDFDAHWPAMRRFLGWGGGDGCNPIAANTARDQPSDCSDDGSR